MKIITWNCNMAFRKKAHLVLNYQPDILVIPECEHLDKFDFPIGTPKPTQSLWFGQNKNKGLGVFTFSDYRFKVLRNHNDNFRMIIPLRVSGGVVPFTLFAIWANNPEDKDGQYVTQVWKAINHYDRTLRKRPAILIGDFNSNTIWDRPRREGNHSTVVTRLGSRGIHSIYHKHFQQIQGKEEHPTHYLYRHQDKPYHLDYCFASDYFADKLVSVEVGDFDFWCQYSDHVPVMATFDLENATLE
jgi:exodeoxyribonuclease III